MTITCVGGHGVRLQRPCHKATDTASCGKPCGRLLSCSHACARACHGGPCTDDTHPCAVRCARLRACGHSCGARCHGDSPCAEGSCTAEVKVSCPCGRRKATVPCSSGQGGGVECDAVCSLMRHVNAKFYASLCATTQVRARDVMCRLSVESNALSAAGSVPEDSGTLHPVPESHHEPAQSGLPGKKTSVARGNAEPATLMSVSQETWPEFCSSKRS